MTAISGHSTSPSRSIKRLCVFCGSSSGNRAEYREAAVGLGRGLVSSGIGLVYGGARVGLMGALADSVLQAGGEAVGVIPRSLLAKEIAHAGLTDLLIVESMHERKARMSDLVDGFIFCPADSEGRICEVVTWQQLGIHQKPCGLLNVFGYYDALVALAAHAVAEGFLRAAHRDLVIVEEDPRQLLSRLTTAPIPTEVRWVRKQGR